MLSVIMDDWGDEENCHCRAALCQLSEYGQSVEQGAGHKKKAAA